MALKDIFAIIKADRYTADGCAEIEKAQKNMAEDAGLPEGTVRHRKDGDYVKQGGKWKPAPAAKVGAKKADKPNPNGVVAQQKQKMETEKHEAARRDAQAPAKKTEVNTPGLRKDVQEAIKRSSPEEIKAYIKELRTPNSRMSRYFDNPDLLANVYEDELKKATESKQTPEEIAEIGRAGREFRAGRERDAKERAAEAQKALVEQIKKEVNNPEMKIRGMNKSQYIFNTMMERHIPKEKAEESWNQEVERVNKLRAESAPAESKPAEAKTYKNEEGRRDFRAAFTENPKDSYDFAKTVEKSIPMSQGDKEELKNLKSFMQDEGADYKQALRSRASNLVDGNKSNGDWYPEKEKSIMKIAKAVGYDKELHQFIEEEFKGYDLGYSEDAAPRVLTGDCKVRVRKSK